MDKKLNVCIIPSWYANYGEDLSGQNFDEAADLQKYCNVAVFHPYDRTLRNEMNVSNEGGILTYRSLLRDGERIKNNIRLLKILRRIRTEFHPDIIYAHVGNEGGKIGAFFARIYKIPIVLAEHSAVEALGLTEGKKKDFWLLKKIYESCNYVACVSDGLKNNLQKYFPELNFHVIYNGIQPLSICTHNMENYKIDGAVNIVIVAGFYSMEIKGFQFLLPAMKQVIEHGHKAVLHICGEGRFREYYENMVKELEIDKICIFYGQCSKEKVYAIVGQSDFFVSASLFESAGVAVQEAMLLGKPVLVTRSGGANSLVTEDTAIVVDKGSTQALADGLEEMIQRYRDFDTEKIREYAENKFEISHISKQYMQVFYDLARKDSQQENDGE